VVCMCVRVWHQDIDECAANNGSGPCGSEEEVVKCVNDDGNYSCECKHGFHFDGVKCSGRLIQHTSLSSNNNNSSSVRYQIIVYPILYISVSDLPREHTQKGLIRLKIFIRHMA